MLVKHEFVDILLEEMGVLPCAGGSYNLLYDFDVYKGPAMCCQ
jgi:hypothetical protein